MKNKRLWHKFNRRNNHFARSQANRSETKLGSEESHLLLISVSSAEFEFYLQIITHHCLGTMMTRHPSLPYEIYHPESQRLQMH